MLFANELPRSNDPNVNIEQFAGSDLIKHPTGMVVTKFGLLLVIESHTHFAPKGYAGPKFDQIYHIEDSDHDGRADKRTVFYNTDLTHTMDIAVHPKTGAIYVATRNEIMRLWDKNGDGKADPEDVERRLVYLDTEGRYPHNGISGLSFDPKGDLYFGLGENLGVKYNLMAKDGSKVSDEGEGGNVFHVTKDGFNLTRIATGFWNPFGVVCTPQGHIFATDNDPSSRPPCRLLNVIKGGDYGYQFRYGRSGQHPFVAWNGEQAGTLPMLHGIGEAPCDIIEERGNLLVASWADHRIEWYPLNTVGNSFKTKQSILIQGGNEFRPVAFAKADENTIYISDWVKRDYNLHGHGAIWVMKGWNPKTITLSEHKTSLEVDFKLEALNALTDPFELTSYIESIRSSKPVLPIKPLTVNLLLAHRRLYPNDLYRVIPEAIQHQNAELRLLGLKWISDKMLYPYRDLAESISKNPKTAIDYHAAITVITRLNGKSVEDKEITNIIAAQLKDASMSESVKAAAVMVLPDREELLSVAEIKTIYEQSESETVRVGLLLTLKYHQDQNQAKHFANEILAKSDSSELKSFAKLIVEGYIKSPSENEVKSRPKTYDVEEWQRYLKSLQRRDEAASVLQGKLVFYQHCDRCHRAQGFGRKGGPDLSTIGSRGEKHILNSILNPGAEVAPQYEPWHITLNTGETVTGFLVSENDSKHIYADIAGIQYKISQRDMVKREQLQMSMMPPGLVNIMNDDDLKSLLHYLVSLK